MFVSWTQFQSCSGSGVASPIQVAIFPDGAASTGPSQSLTPPGSTYSQGSSIQPDGNGGFWLAWEEYSNATSSATESVKLAHWQPSTGWSGVGSGTAAPTTISPSSYTDLPSPLRGFAFRDNSFPVLAMVGGQPWVAWTSSDSGVGRTYLSIAGGVPSSPLSNGAGNQFFPAITPDGSGGAYVSFSQANGPYTSVSSANSYDQWVVPVTSTGSAGGPSQVSTASSYPNLDQFFNGKFIGDYNGMTVNATTAYPIWTDIRGLDPNYPGYEMDPMVAAPSSRRCTSGGVAELWWGRCDSNARRAVYKTAALTTELLPRPVEDSRPRRPRRAHTSQAPMPWTGRPDAARCGPHPSSGRRTWKSNTSTRYATGNEAKNPSIPLHAVRWRRVPAPDGSGTQRYVATVPTVTTSSTKSEAANVRRSPPGSDTRWSSARS